MLSTVLLFHGRIRQKELLHQNSWLSEYDQLDYQPVGTAEQQEAYNFLQFAMVTWLASLLFDARIIQFIHYDIVSMVHDISHNLSWCKMLVTNSLTVVAFSSGMEMHFICSISGDWNVFIYMLLSTTVKILRTITQGI